MSTVVLNKKNNFFDIVIIVLIASLCTGLIGGAWTLPRVLTIATVPILLSKVSYLRNSYIRPLLFFFGFWMIYNLVSLAWTPDVDKGLKEYAYFITYFVLFIEIACFSKISNNPFRSIMIGWVFFVLITGTIGMWELFTDQHLAVSSMGSDEMKYSEGEFFKFYYASSTFGNYNTFVTVLCFALPFVLYAIANASCFSKLFNILSIVALLEIIFVLFYNGSRGGLFSLGIMAVVFIIHMRKLRNGRGGSKFWFFILVLLIVGVFIYMGDVLLATIRFRSSHSNILEDNTRTSIITYAFDIFLDTFGFGTGIGGLYDAMKAKRGTGGTIAPHNLFVELGVQYGILIFSVFLYYVYKLFKLSIKTKDRYKRLFFQMVIFSMPTTMVINSFYLMQTAFWIYFACVYVFAFLKIPDVTDYENNNAGQIVVT